KKMTPTPLQYFTKDHAVSMTMRDYFAAKAMQGFYSSSYYNESYDTLSEMAYKKADAMMKAREA
ncbi:hypothetical protein, partial [Streptococcus pneumoniae]|uniref:hypothetical protein n=1 Tax=Streptococcus pneumoniae TaxID=1313 RepID=UPI0018B0A659